MSVTSVYKKCLKKGLTIAFAESMTGGGLSYAMTKIPGASKVLIGGVVAYQVEQKVSLLGIDPLCIETLGVVSSEVSKQMAINVSHLMKSDIGIGITGNAGPTRSDEKADLEGYVCIYMNKQPHIFHLDFKDLSREKAIKKAISYTYEQLEKLIL